MFLIFCFNEIFESAFFRFLMTFFDSNSSILIEIDR